MHLAHPSPVNHTSDVSGYSLDIDQEHNQRDDDDDFILENSVMEVVSNRISKSSQFASDQHAPFQLFAHDGEQEQAAASSARIAPSAPTTGALHAIKPKKTKTSPSKCSPSPTTQMPPSASELA